MIGNRAPVLGVAAVAGVAGLVGALAAGCAKVGTEPTSVVSLGFDTSSVAVAVGDTLRDTLGRPLRLRAAAFNARGDTVHNEAAPITYLFAAADTGVLQIADTLVIGQRLRSTPASVFATAGGLQSLPKRVDVIPRPTRLTGLARADSAPFRVGLLSALSVGGAQLRVAGDSSGTSVGVRRVIVRFALERAAPGVADSAALIDERDPTLTRIPRSLLDTTDATGQAGRRVLLFLRAGAARRDTVVIRATLAYPVTYPGTTAGTDTIRIVVPVVPTAAP